VSDAPVLSIVKPMRAPWDELVECLREKLAQAERGELTAFAYHNVGSSAYKMVGAIEALKTRVVMRHLQPDPGSEFLE
jgi:hypothetical protein